MKNSSVKFRNWLLFLLVSVSMMAVFFTYRQLADEPITETTETTETTEKTETTEEVEPVRPAFEFHGMRCTTLRQNPIFTYDVQRQTVTLEVECAPELMLNYFEAEKPAGSM